MQSLRMLKCAADSLKPHLRTLHTRSSRFTSGHRFDSRFHPWVLVSSTITATAAALWFSRINIIHNDTDAISPEQIRRARQLQLDKTTDTSSDVLHTLLWGSNTSNTISPDAPNVDSVRTPTVATWLENVALRDLALHLKHAACVDARGDVYQWGDGFFGSTSKQSANPSLTLRGKNIKQLQLTESRLFALSASGKVYALSTDISWLKIPKAVPISAGTPWWGIGWFWGEEESVDFVELTPKENLARGEKIVSMAAGNDHLLALTSNGRTYAHPITNKANDYGQLGFRKFHILDSSWTVPNTSLLTVELVPKSFADPYAKASPFIRAPLSPLSPPALHNTNINNSTIRSCTNLFEIPVLRDVKAVQVAAGGRSSYIRTQSGKVLGWGANEYGQIGLGSNITLDTIAVPTEVILWGTASNQARTKCLDISAGGDLTCFTVERGDESSSTTVDLLMCGNGQWGGLGNNMYSNAQGTPVRARNVSGLLEYSERTKSLQPILPLPVNISATGHVLLTLNTSKAGAGGRDLVVWGKNHEYELGNGKKSSLPVPTMLSTPDGGRFMLRATKAKEVKDLRGNVWKRDVKVEQCAVAGHGNSMVYWKISG